VDPTNPQSWNRYAYVVNSPTTMTDPKGLYLRSPGGGWGDYGCTIDGFAVDCAEAAMQARAGAVAGCPYNVCSASGTNPFTGQPMYVTFQAFSDGGSGYYRPGQAPQQNQLAAELEWIRQLVSWNNSSRLPDVIVIAIIWEESNFNLLAINHQGGGFGAIGLMQVRQIGLEDFNQSWLPQGATPYTMGDLWDPILNVYIGTGELYNDVFRYNGGNVAAGLNWYGTGPGYSDMILNTAASIGEWGAGGLK